MNNRQKSYMESAVEISGIVSELQAFADKMHDRNPDRILWGDVGDLQYIKATLSALMERTRQTA